MEQIGPDRKYAACTENRLHFSNKRLEYFKLARAVEQRDARVAFGDGNAEIRNDLSSLWSKARLGLMSMFVKHGPRRPVW